MFKYVVPAGLAILIHASTALALPTSLLEGESIFSSDGRFQLIMQSDGNLVLYGLDVGALWAAGTYGTNADRAVMRADGNLVVYDGATALWSSNTHGNPNSELVVQDDGNVVIYSPDGVPIWDTGTYGLGQWSPRHLINNSGTCLDVHGHNFVANLTNVQTWSCDEVTETWYLGLDEKLHAGWAPGVCLDILGTNATANGTNAGILSCDEVAETWALGQDGLLRAQWDSQVCLDVDGVNPTESGPNVQIWNCAEVTETWSFAPSSDPLVEIASHAPDTAQSMLSPLIGLFSMSNVRVYENPDATSGVLVSVDGTIDLDALAGATPLEVALRPLVDIAQELGSPNPMPASVVLSTSELGELDLALDLEIVEVDAFRHIDLFALLGTAYRFSELHVVFHMTAGLYGPSFPIDAYGEGFVKVSSNDHWVGVVPTITWDGDDVTFGGRLIGQCGFAPEAWNSVDACDGSWNVLGQNVVIADREDGEVGDLSVTYTGGAFSGIEAQLASARLNLPVQQLVFNGTVEASPAVPERWVLQGGVQYGVAWFDVAGTLDTTTGLSLSGARGVSTPIASGTTTLTVSSESASAQFVGSLCGNYTHEVTSTVCSWLPWPFGEICDTVTNLVTDTACSPEFSASVGTNGQICTNVPLVGNVCANVL